MFLIGGSNIKTSPKRSEHHLQTQRCKLKMTKMEKSSVASFAERLWQRSSRDFFKVLKIKKNVLHAGWPKATQYALQHLILLLIFLEVRSFTMEQKALNTAHDWSNATILQTVNTQVTSMLIWFWSNKEKTIPAPHLSESSCVITYQH